MGTLDVQTAMKNIANGKFEPLYVLVGEERYFSDRCLSQLRHSVVGTELREFNEDIFYGSEVDLEKLLDALEMLPVMADHRLIVLKEAHHLSEKQWLQLEQVKDLTGGRTVFVIQAQQLDRRKKSIKKIIDRSALVECQTPQDAARAPWIRSLAKERGLELEPEALGYLVQMGGNTLEELDRDLDKLFLFFGEPKKISIGDVAKVLERTREESIFALAETIGKRDRTQALFLFHRLHGQGESEIALVALIARHLRILWKIKSAQSLGLKGPTLAQRVGVNNYFLGNYIQQASLWTVAQLTGALEDLAQIDKQLKSSSLPPETWLQNFLLFS